MMIAYPTTGEQDTATNALVNRLQDDVLPRATAGTGIRAYLTGPERGRRGVRQPRLAAPAVADRAWSSRCPRCC